LDKGLKGREGYQTESLPTGTPKLVQPTPYLDTIPAKSSHPMRPPETLTDQEPGRGSKAPKTSIDHKNPVGPPEREYREFFPSPREHVVSPRIKKTAARPALSTTGSEAIVASHDHEVGGLSNFYVGNIETKVITAFAAEAPVSHSGFWDLGVDSLWLPMLRGIRN
jgi:hypothetical protein